MQLNYGRISGCVLGGCLIVSALQCPEIGFHIPGYLADIFLGQFFSAFNGVVWLLASMAGIGLIAARPSACWLLYIAFGYTLIPKFSEFSIPKFSFFPFVSFLGSWLEINGATIAMATRMTNLLFVCFAVAVHVAIVKNGRRSRVRSIKETQRAAIIVLSLSAGAIILFVGTLVPLIHDAILGADIRSVNLYAIAVLLFFNLPLWIWGVPAFIVSCYRLCSIYRTRRQLQKNDQHVDTVRPATGIMAEGISSRLRFTRRSLCVVVLVSVMFVAAAVATWMDAIDPARYNRHFHEVIAWADRVVVRQGGFDCCGSVDNQAILFEVVDPVEIAQLRERIQLIDEKPGDGCLCCGYPGIDWYRDGRRIALTAIQHGFGLRWRRFPGDAGLTDASQQSLRQWFSRHGLSEKDLGWTPLTATPK